MEKTVRTRFGGGAATTEPSQKENVEIKFPAYKSRKSLIYEDKHVANMVAERNDVKVMRGDEDVTPKHIISLDSGDINDIKEQAPLWGETTRITRMTVIDINDRTDKEFGLLGAIPDINDIIGQFERTGFDTEDDTSEKEKPIAIEQKMPAHMKIILHETENISFYEMASVTVSKHSDEAKEVEEDNLVYEYLAYGKGRNRRRSEAETQTSEVLYKNRWTNTEQIEKLSVDTFVSNYDMYDTYADLARVTKSIDMGNQKLEVTTYSNDDAGISKKLATNENFRLSSMVIERLLSSNVFEKQQKRYRNMYPPDPLDPNAKYLYRLDTLWVYQTAETLRKAVSCVSWCEANSDILAVGYGVYSFVAVNRRREGQIYIWSMKNPVNPERKYRFSQPVTACCFSKKNPQLLAVGLYHGAVKVIDIIKEDDAMVSKSNRETSPSYEPVWDIKWISGEDSFGINEQILAIFQDGRVMKYSFITGPFLLGYQQLRLTRVEGVVEGIPVVKKVDFVQANRYPQAFCLTMHPLKVDDYFVGTDEGCLHRSSINFPHQHKIQVHQGGVYAIEFSPWSPKVFLTCGSDWYVRIWVEDIFAPICELLSGIGVIQYACWSPVNPTILASVSKSRLEIWDLRRKNLKPARIHTFGMAEPLTVIRFTKDGHAIIVGDEQGKTYMCALEDMPFPPHYPYNELQSVLYKLMDANPELLKQVKSLGYLGY